jgi:two-component system, NtrC family, response regulator AtoC
MGEASTRLAEFTLRTAEMLAVYDMIDRVANSRIAVLLSGETGVGKEVLARTIHERSDRRSSPFVCVNCGAIPDELVHSALFGHEKGAFTGANAQATGVFEAGNGGTVLLDEIGEMRLGAQVSLLRVLETSKIVRVGGTRSIPADIRVIAATNRNLEEMVRTGQFREDLFYRLEKVHISIPPLRQRVREILPLALTFLQEANTHHGRGVVELSPEVIAALEGYDWPGNVRELRNAIERGVVLAAGVTLQRDDLPPRVLAFAASQSGVRAPALVGAGDGGQSATAQSLRTLLRAYEEELLLFALDRAGGNQTRAAALLGIPRRTLIYKLRRLRRTRRTSYILDAIETAGTD